MTMAAFVDSSAVGTLYADETGPERVRRTRPLARAEAPAALRRGRTIGQRSASAPPVLVATLGLRAYDGVQLASACQTRDAIGNVVAFLGFDKTLGAAAAAEGLRVE